MRQISISDDAYQTLVTRHGDLSAFLENIAKQDQESVEANPNGSKPEQSLYRALVEDGLVGKYADLPADLSANPSYLDDLGQ